MPEFRLRDKVLLKVIKAPVGLSPKFYDKQSGPFYISKLLPNHTYKLRRCSDHKELKSTFIATQLKVYQNPEHRRLGQPQDNIDVQNRQNIPVVQNNQRNIPLDKNPRNNPPQIPNSHKRNETSVDRTSQIHPHNDNNPQPGAPPNDDIAYEVDRILKKKNIGDIPHYLVKWKHHTKRTWQPEYDFSPRLLEDFNCHYTPKGKRRKRPYRFFTKLN